MIVRRATSALRGHEKRVVPREGIYDIDPEHSSVEFVSGQLMIATVRGRFPDVGGRITIADRPTESHVEATIGTKSVSTGNAERDAHLRGARFLDVERFPTMSFTSIAVVELADGDWAVDGRLTVRSVIRRVTLHVAFEGCDVSSAGGRIRFSATATLDREDFGLGSTGTSDAGALLVDKRVSVELLVHATTQRSDG
jgi:polyisoprenoid-binding protein YceI